jgi:putative SOS response-associated peptidase YedK
MNGYFEWTGPKGDKQPHFISAGGELLSAAGLYEVRKVDDRWEVSCVVITRTGEDSAGEVHDRMPVFLTPDVWDQWLSPDELSAKGKDGALSMLDHSSREVASTLTTYTVDRKVNSTRTADPRDPTLVQPVAANGATQTNERR